MTAFLYHLGRLCARHRIPVAGAWIAAWWFPRWLDVRLPQVSVEGHGYFSGRASADVAVAEEGVAEEAVVD